MPIVSAISGPVPRGLRAAFVVLTLAAAALAVAAGIRGIWFLTAICGLFAVLNLGVLWATRSRSGHPVQTPAEDPADERSGSTAD
jgi:hypothetical protein